MSAKRKKVTLPTQRHPPSRNSADGDVAAERGELEDCNVCIQIQHWKARKLREEHGPPASKQPRSQQSAWLKVSHCWPVYRPACQSIIPWVEQVSRQHTGHSCSQSPHVVVHAVREKWAMLVDRQAEAGSGLCCFAPSSTGRVLVDTVFAAPVVSGPNEALNEGQNERTIPMCLPPHTNSIHHNMHQGVCREAHPGCCDPLSIQRLQLLRCACTVDPLRARALLVVMAELPDVTAFQCL
jgi:hypothetical protein